MKRVLVLVTVAMMAFSALAVCGPYFGVSQEGDELMPEFVVGMDIGGRIGDSGWILGVDASLTDPDFLELGDNWFLALDVSGAWGGVATVNQTGSLTYGCIFSVDQALELDPTDYSTSLGLEAWTVGLIAEGYVGPFSAWFGCDFKWGTTMQMTPVAGFLVHW